MRYCYCEKIKTEKDGVVSTPHWHSGNFQICRIPELFPDFERDINKNRFNMTVLNRYYDQLFKELVKIFEEHAEAVDCFHGREYVSGGRDRLSGKYWRVTLSESIQ